MNIPISIALPPGSVPVFTGNDFTLDDTQSAAVIATLDSNDAFKLDACAAFLSAAGITVSPLCIVSFHITSAYGS